MRRKISASLFVGVALLTIPLAFGQPVMAAPSKEAQTATYNVMVKTGTQEGAGTDANVYLYVRGARGTLGPVQLDNREDNFERNKTDRFEFEARDMGAMRQVCLRRTNSGWYPAWHLAYVRINGVTFPFNKWVTTAWSCTAP
jgi:PLAT/LH2 domain